MSRITERQRMPGSDLPTATTVLDSILFRDASGTPQMRAVFSDFALIA
jgi:3-carboxy-cis,cis-muconate cycloisomerase